MSFPPGDTARAFEHFLQAESVAQHLQKARPDLAQKVAFDELRLLVQVPLPDGRSVVYARLEHRGVVGWAIVTPGSVEDLTATEFFAVGSIGEIATRILDEYNRLVSLSTARPTLVDHT